MILRNIHEINYDSEYLKAPTPIDIKNNLTMYHGMSVVSFISVYEKYLNQYEDGSPAFLALEKSSGIDLRDFLTNLLREAKVAFRIDPLCTLSLSKNEAEWVSNVLVVKDQRRK